MSELAGRCETCGKLEGQHRKDECYPDTFPGQFFYSPAPTEGATMKDSHGQTVQVARLAICPEDTIHDGIHLHCTLGAGHIGEHVAPLTRVLFYQWAPEPHAPTTVQDYRDYTEREILLGILESTEQSGWGDPANLGHWLGAAQRWKERV